MAKPQLDVHVKHRTTISPNLTKVVLAGDELKSFPPGFEGGYIKLVLPSAGDKPAVRSYTVCEFNQEAGELVIEMVSHGDKGPAAQWANRVADGEAVRITFPGACKLINSDADWFLLAGDMSALPAIRVNIDRLPDNATGHIVLEVIEKADKLALNAPPGMDITWIINPEPDADNSLLEDTVMALPWRSGAAAVWVAGEFSASRALRQYFRNERALHKDNMYVSCYWKIGETDEGLKQAKRADTEDW